MKTLLLAVVIAMVSTAAEACAPSKDDYKALAESPSHLTPAMFSALTPDQQNRVCETRVFMAKIDANHGVMTHMDDYSIKYLSPAENQRMITATNNFTNALLKSKGF
jgi:hypothetical protein